MSCPIKGNAGGRRAKGLAGQVPWGTPRPPHATAREHASKGSYRNPLRTPNDLPGRERIAHHNLAVRRPAPGGLRGPGGAAGAVRSAPIPHL